MLNLEKYNISVEREAEMCNEEGEQKDIPLPRWYDDKSETPFVTAKGKDLSIHVPFCKNVHECYNKFEEITNVLLCELHNKSVIFCPFTETYGLDNAKPFFCVKISISNEYFEKVHVLCDTEIDNINGMYTKICENFNKRVNKVYNIFGKAKANFDKEGVKVYLYSIDYRDKCGLKESYLGFLVAFVFSCAFKYDAKVLSDISWDETEEYLEFVSKTDKVFGLGLSQYIESVRKEISECTTLIDCAEKMMVQENCSEYMLEIAKKYSDEGYNSRYKLKEYPNLVAEAVALIKDAILAGVDYEVLNPGKNMTEFINSEGKREIVVEGNKTNKDSYIFPFITDDKFYAKRMLKQNDLKTPEGVLISKDMPELDINSAIGYFENKPVVIKPRNTNYGIGITVYPDGTSIDRIKSAVEYAFSFDNNAILEEYVKGMEYRFLIVNGKCLSVAYRRSASVVGDGIHSIKELIELKNKEPWHALTGTPVKMDEPVVEFLRVQGLTLDNIPLKDKRVTLRKNSNCSTGGESIVITEEMPGKFKTAAECAAKAFDAKICGIDIIIDDLEGDEYNIIEVNDMPGYSINEWPYEGKGERVGIEVLKLLNLIK